MGLFKNVLGHEKTKFIIVGGIGFIVNYLSLVLFFGLLHFPILTAQILGAEIAVLATFVGNNFWAFQDHNISMKKKVVRFHLSAGAGLLINSGLVVALVHFWSIYYGLALAIGSAAALIWNYTLYKRFVFHRNNDSEAEAYK